MKELERRLVQYHRAAALVASAVFPMFLIADYIVAPDILSFLWAVLFRLGTAAYLLIIFFAAGKIPPRVHHWLYPITTSIVALALSLITIIFKEPLYLIGMLLVFFGGATLVVDEPRWTITNIAGMVIFGLLPPLLFLLPYMTPKLLSLMILYDLGSLILGITVNIVMWRNAKELVLERERSARLEESEKAAMAIAQEAEALLRGAGELREASQRVKKSAGFLTSEVARLASFAEEVSRSADEVARATEQIASGAAVIEHLASESHREVAEAVAKELEAQGIRERVFALAEELRREFQELAAAASQVWALAKKTRILSVNAGVEAARSGEPALTVVAEQIKGLAGEVREATGALTTRVKGLGELVRKILETLGSYGEVISEAVAKVGRIEEMVSGVLGETEGLARSAEGIDDAAKGQARSSEEVAGALASLQQAAERLERLAEDLAKTAGVLESASV